jgi:hypothetical protein
MSYVCYHLPSDRDDPEHPNAFQINKHVEEITLQDIKENFPLPGKYHFRFKVRLGESNSSYWMDITDNSRIVPSFGPRRIIAKVLRLSWEGSYVIQKPVANATSTTSRSSVISSESKQTLESFDLFSAAPPVAPNRNTSPPKMNVGDLNLFG